MTAATSDLPRTLTGERLALVDSSVGRVSYYVAGPEGGRDRTTGPPRPLLLIHSVNAAASAHEVRPLYDAFRGDRRTYAIDLPGYGHSDRSDRPYLPRLMIDAIHALLERIRAETGVASVDVLAASLSSEFLARAAREAPATIRSVALVSPTGFSRKTRTRGSPEDNRGVAAVYRFLTLPIIGRALYRGLTSRLSVRFFLRKTFGRKDIDEELFRMSVRMTRHPDARYAPFHFLSGYLFSANIPAVYDELEQPVWLSHGVRGDFTDFSRASNYRDRPNWRITEYPTGALPYFEVTDEFVRDYRAFLADTDKTGDRDGHEDGDRHRHA
ncbi:alpha/beta fold hydrolase [Halomonas denitrificans]|nr:alpha/beta fold hydrolase [Halomonas denitrificans]